MRMSVGLLPVEGRRMVLWTGERAHSSTCSREGEGDEEQLILMEE